MSFIYLEKQLKDSYLALKIINKFPRKEIIEINHYSEVFNPSNQNFRKQKQNPAIIIAKKTNNLILKSPESFGIGGTQNFYFSHMLNCPYDCRYCFLQGMFNSANYVIFVNHDDFKMKIKSLDNKAQTKQYFFSGYDADSLAFDHVTDFTNSFVPFFHSLKNSILELRTKSTQIRPLLNFPANDNIIIAFSFTPKEISETIEHKVPDFSKRLTAIKKLINHGYNIGLRFDPLIYSENYQDLYAKMITEIFTDFNIKKLHSISLGKLRFPNKMYDKIIKLYPKDKLLNYQISKDKKYTGYRTELESEMFNFVETEIKRYVDPKIIFKCYA
ncbi:MAG: DNA photolyase [Rickettsiales bacterium]|nr:DNA photolyase [Rickettsiales bacterium]